MINRISIVGGPGTGKTTLGNMLSEILEIPVLHIDGLFYEPNWVERDEDERDRKILEFAKKERWIIDGNYRSTLKWIIDGNYRSTLKQRVDKADLIIFLDYSNLARMKGIFQRFFKYRGKEREEIPGCIEKMDYTFIKYTWNYNKNKRSSLIDFLNSVDQNKILTFKNRNKLNKWLKEVEKTKSIQL